MLSGGIDSGAIAAVAANELRTSGGPTLRTHSVARVDTDTDLESECIRAIVAQLGCESTIMTLSQMLELSGVTRRAGLHSCNFFDCLMTVPDLIYRSLRDEGTRLS